MPQNIWLHNIWGLVNYVAVLSVGNALERYIFYHISVGKEGNIMLVVGDDDDRYPTIGEVP